MERGQKDLDPTVELWGGPECTVNRLGNQWHDQLQRTGHADRLSDLDLIADLGIRTVRVPLLWERACATVNAPPDIRWARRYMGRVQELGLKPIIGLMHHGSGPQGTDLLDPHMPDALAKYAEYVALMFPDAEHFTPINEPLTTARFSGLYGHWYPHEKNDEAFVGCLVNQVIATVRAMGAIRCVIPHARLLQTEDLGRAEGTAEMLEQVRFENDRRWLSLDLLTGRVDEHHPLWWYLTGPGKCPLERLYWLQRNACPPDMIGINHYVESNRYLDHRLQMHPAVCHGSNGSVAYADIPAYRSPQAANATIADVLLEAWSRYQLPLALTECQLACTREEQIRWLRYQWRGALEARKAGVDIRAVTAWGLFGQYDWDSLLTRQAETYCAGAYDVRTGAPVPTGLARVIHSLAVTGDMQEPLSDQPGWWERDVRHSPGHGAATNGAGDEHRPLLVVGGGGTLGGAFGRICRERGIPYRLLARTDLDIARPGSTRAALEHYRPWAVVNAAGYVDVDKAEAEAEACYRSNATGAIALARACAEAELPYLTFSSDLVFGEGPTDAILEDHRPGPLNVYGHSKVHAEEGVSAAHASALIVRTAGFFGPWDRYNFVWRVVERLAQGHGVYVPDDVIASYTYVPDLVHACLDLIIDRATGIRHVVNAGKTSWFRLAVLVAERAGMDRDLVKCCRADQMGWKAARPSFSALGTDHGLALPHYRDALERYFQHAPVQQFTSMVS